MLRHRAECLFPTLRVNDLQPAFFAICFFSLRLLILRQWDYLAGQVEAFKNTLCGVTQEMAERFHAIKRAVDGLQLRPDMLALAHIWLHGSSLGW